MTVNNGKPVVTQEKNEQADVTLTIGTLALLAFGAMDVNDLVFNEKLQGNEQALQTLQALFPTEKTGSTSGISVFCGSLLVIRGS